jgi:uncharacterized protein (DUF4415 family)
MKKRGKVRATPADAPAIDPDDSFWKKAHIVETRRKASVHLRLDPDTLAFYRAAGRCHLTRMANILRLYAERQGQLKPSER